jgi:hypothetical protein
MADGQLSRRGLLAGLAVAGAAAAGAGVAQYLASDSDDAGDDGGTGVAVTVYGAPGSFSRMEGRDRLPSGERVRTVGVPGWGFGLGQAAYMSAVADDGTVFVATTPYSDDQARLTGVNMEIGVFRPGGPQFTRLVVPSTTGALEQHRPEPAYRGIGGADIGDVQLLRVDGQERVAFVSATPYFGWDTGLYGELPTFGQLRIEGRRWAYAKDLSRTAEQLAASMADQGAAQAAFPSHGGSPRSNRGTTELALLPRSNHLIVAQYYGEADGRPGALLVLDPSGRVRAWWQYPAVRVLGQDVVCHPRDVSADPSSTDGDERFAVVADSTDRGGRTVPFTVQEFAYSAVAGTITPRSTAVRAAQDGSRMETTAFGADGTLFVARTAADGLAAAPLAVYRKHGGERRLVTETPARADWPTASWGSTCAPDQTVAGTDRGGLVRSLAVDPVTGAVLVAGLNGLLQTVRPVGPAGPGGPAGWRAGRAVDFGLDLLRGPARHYVGIRKGCIDARRRVLWVPANQLILNDLAWPYPPFRLDQWLYRFDLRAHLEDS